MEKFHPFLYFDIFPGLSAFPNIVYSWVVMLVLIVSSLLVTKTLQKIPIGGQNVFEAIFDAFSAFMEGPLGKEDDTFSPSCLRWAPISFCATSLEFYPVSWRRRAT